MLLSPGNSKEGSEMKEKLKKKKKRYSCGFTSARFMLSVLQSASVKPDHVFKDSFSLRIGRI